MTKFRNTISEGENTTFDSCFEHMTNIIEEYATPLLNVKREMTNSVRTRLGSQRWENGATR